MSVRHLMCAAVALLILGSAERESLAETITNGGFETGDLTGWTVNASDLVSVEFSVEKLGEPGLFFPAQGDRFAYLRTGIEADQPTLLTQDFTADDLLLLSFSIFFDAGDDLSNDYGFARLLDDDGGLVAELFRSDVAAVGPFGSTGWTLVTHTIGLPGRYTLQFGVANMGDNDSFFDSVLGVDAVIARVVPEPSSFGSALMAVIAVLGYSLMRRVGPEHPGSRVCPMAAQEK